MNGSGFRRWSAAPGEDLAPLREAGLIRKGLHLVPPEGLERPARVRPPADDSLEHWTRDLQGAIDLARGARIGVAADDAPLAGAMAVDLAAALGDAGGKVVLIDGSIERPSLAKALPDDGDEGLVDMVTFGVSSSKAVRRTLAPGVSLVTAGSYPLSEADVFAAEAFGGLLEKLAADATVLVVLGRRHLSEAVPALTSVLAVGTSVDAIRALAEEAPGLETVGVLIGPGEPSRAVEEGGPAALEARAPSEEAGGAGPAPGAGGAPGLEAASGSDASGGPEGGSEVAAEGGAAAWGRLAGGAPVTAARPRALVRRRSRAPLVVGIAVVASVLVVGWLGMRAVRGPSERTASRPIPPRSEAGRAGKPSAPPPGTRETARESEAGGPGAVGEGRTGLAPGGTRAESGGRPERGAGGEEEVSTAPRTEEPVPPGAQAEVGRAPAGTIVGPGGPYALFVTSHHVESEAEVEVEILRREGIEVSIVPTEVGTTGVWYRVAVAGGYPTLAAAREALAEVQKLGHEGAWIERHASSR